jgi:hypothetical protein
MKGIARNLVVVLVSVLALTALSIAQDDTYHLYVNVPFDFYAADHQLPAGTYLITVSYESRAVILRNQETGRSLVFLGIPADGEKSGQAVVEFNVVGDNHYLADLKTSDAGVSFASNARASTSAKLKGSVAIVATLR